MDKSFHLQIIAIEADEHSEAFRIYTENPYSRIATLHQKIGCLPMCVYRTSQGNRINPEFPVALCKHNTVSRLITP